MNDKVENTMDADDGRATVLNIGNGAAAAAAPAFGAPAAARPATPRDEMINAVSERLKSLSIVQKFLLGMAGALVAIVVASTVFSTVKSDYRVLFSNVTEQDMASIVASLQQTGVPYKFTEGGGALMVPADRVYETRLALASQGLPKSGFVGFELLENQKLGTSQFVEQVNYQRGLEGELARSISALSSVNTARVHLAVPKQSAFVRERQPPTASVVLSLHPGRFLDQRQALAIAHLVGSSVPGMSAREVTILDSEGSLLSPSPDRDAGLDSSQLKYVQEIEAALARRVSAILEPITGKDNVKAQVTLDMDFNLLSRTQETYGPNSPPNPSSIRSQQTIQAEGAGNAPGGIPGALTNQPPPNATAPIQGQPGAAKGAQELNAPGAPGTPRNFRNEQTTNYEVDRTIEYLKRSPGEIRRVSAAVVVNFKNELDPATGQPQPAPYSAQEINQMIALARDAVGFRQERGDSVSVANIPFTPPVTEETPFYKDAATIELAKEIGKVLVILGALTILFAAVVRPILFPKPKLEAAAKPKIDEEIDEKVKAELALLSPESREKRRLEIELAREKERLEQEERERAEREQREMEEEERRRKARSVQEEYEELLQYARDYVAKDPKIVATVFKGWMAVDSRQKS